MFNYRWSIFGCILLALSGCAKPDQSIEDQYINSSASISGLSIPPGVNAPKQSPYYPIPSKKSQVSGQVSPSIQPPVLSSSRDSSISKRTSMANRKQSSTVQAMTLILPKSTAWNKLSDAIKKDPHLKLVDQDIDKRVMYVLNIKKTSGSISKKTPVRLISLESVSAGDQVMIQDDQGKSVGTDESNAIISRLKGYML